MNVRCPHCHSLIDSIDDASFVDVCCPSCGSSFSLIGDDMTKTHQPPRARLLAQFKLVRQLGIGKFGAVWLAQDTQLDRTVAIKIPRKEALDAEEAEAFFRDARAAAGLKHPNIVSVHEVGRQEDTVYIVTDYIDGANLREWLTGQRLSFRESAELLIKVAEAVHHAHQGGVVHRDLKPGNIMLDRDGEPHVIDFGLARRESGDMTVTFDGHILGTPAYMSPEQAKGRAHEADRRSDVYSLGVILFELLSGELPFRGEAQMLLLQIERDEPPRPRRLNSRVPRDLETITLKCLQKEPGRRYQTAQDLADDLRHWMRREPIVARPVGQIERGWRWARRNPLVAGLSAALVLILLGGIVVSNRFAIEANARAKDALAEKARADSEREKAEDARKLEAEQALRAQLAEAQATQDARRASLEAQKAQEVASFLAKMFEDFAPFKLVGLRFGSTQKTEAAANMTAREILDRGAERITAELADQPAVQAALKDTIGDVYLGLGMLDKATVMIEEAYELRAKHVPRESLDMAASLYSLAALRFAQMRFVHSAQAFEEALAIRRKLLGDDHELVDATRESLASLLGIFRPRDSDRDIHEARQLFRESLEWRRKHLGNKHRDTAMAMFGLAATLLSFSTDDAEGLGGAVQLMVTRGPEAASLLAEATPILLSDPDTKALGVAVTQAQIAELRIIMGRPEAAVPYTRKALAALREVVDDNHPAMHIAKGIAVRHLALAGQYDEAEKIYRECLTLARERNLTVPLIFVTFLRSFAEPLLEQDQPRAVALYRDTYEITKYVLLRDRQSQVDMAPDPGAYAFITWNYANVLEECDKYVEAEATCREGLELVPRDYRGGFETLRLTLYLGDALQAQGRFAEAEKLCRRGLELAESCQFPPRVEGDFWKSRGLYELARALQSQGKLEDSAKYCQNVKALGDETWAPRAEELLAEINGKPSSD